MPRLAKHLCAHRERPFARRGVTKYYRSWLGKFIIKVSEYLFQTLYNLNNICYGLRKPGVLGWRPIPQSMTMKYTISLMILWFLSRRGRPPTLRQNQMVLFLFHPLLMMSEHYS